MPGYQHIQHTLSQYRIDCSMNRTPELLMIKRSRTVVYRMKQNTLLQRRKAINVLDIRFRVQSKIGLKKRYLKISPSVSRSSKDNSLYVRSAGVSCAPSRDVQ